MGWLLAAVVAVVVGVVAGPKWVLAPLLGYVVFRVGTAMIGNLVAGGRHGADEAPVPVGDRPERTVYWCEQCGAELLLVVRGAATPPRHCGERMHERVELLRDT